MTWSKKFLHAIGIQVIGSVALFTGHIDGGTWLAVSTLTLGIHSAADVVEKRSK